MKRVSLFILAIVILSTFALATGGNWFNKDFVIFRTNSDHQSYSVEGLKGGKATLPAPGTSGLDLNDVNYQIQSIQYLYGRSRVDSIDLDKGLWGNALKVTFVQGDPCTKEPVQLNIVVKPINDTLPTLQFGLEGFYTYDPAEETVLPRTPY